MNSDGGRNAAGRTPGALLLRSRVPAQAAGQLLLDYLASRFRYLDRAGWQQELAAGRIELDGKFLTDDHLLQKGASLCYHKVGEEPVVNRDVRVLHIGTGFAVIDKPAHLPMHSDGPFVRNTLVHILRSGAIPEALLVHRLDRETSGVCVIARNRAARAHLERQFAGGGVQKTYLAVVVGTVLADFTVDAPIGEASESEITMRRSASPTARNTRPSRTDFCIAARGAGRTLLRCIPYSGRTHQIRVHLELAGHPVLGDKLYGRPDADYLAFVTRVKAGGDARDVGPGQPDRHLLHASELQFEDPDVGGPMRFMAPTPEVFLSWLGEQAPTDRTSSVPQPGGKKPS